MLYEEVVLKYSLEAIIISLYRRVWIYDAVTLLSVSKEKRRRIENTSTRNTYNNIFDLPNEKMLSVKYKFLMRKKHLNQKKSFQEHQILKKSILELLVINSLCYIHILYDRAILNSNIMIKIKHVAQFCLLWGRTNAKYQVDSFTIEGSTK